MLTGNAKRSTLIAKSGFTLIELLIVITIIAILIASATYSWQNAQAKGRDGKRKSDLKAVQQALQLYFEDKGNYPPSDGLGKIKCDVISPGIDWGQAFTCGTATYMQQLPKDPRGTDPYYYQSAGAFSYTIWALLENANDPNLVGLPCTASLPWNYCVINP